MSDHMVSTPQRFDSVLSCDASMLEPHRGAALLKDYGVLHVKKCLPRKALHKVRNLAHDAGLYTKNGGHLLDIELDPKSLRFDIVREIHRSIVAKILRSYFDTSSILVSCHNSFFRLIRPSVEDSQLPFHQDGAGFDPAFPAVTISMIVDPNSSLENCPRIQFLPGHHNSSLRKKSDQSDSGSYAFLEISPAELSRYSPEEFWAPQLDVGDVLIFDKNTVHRSFVEQNMSRIRVSLDIRFWPFIPVYLTEDALKMHQFFISHPHFLHGPKKMDADLTKQYFELSYARGFHAGKIRGNIFSILSKFGNSPYQNVF